MLSTAGTYAASNKVRCGVNSEGKQPKRKSKKNKPVRQSLDINCRDIYQYAESPRFSSGQLESFDSKRGQKVNRSTRRRSSDSIDINRNIPDYLANLKPGEIDCPCLLHCQRRSREHLAHPTGSLPGAENSPISSIATNRLSLDSQLLSTSNPRLNSFSREMSDIKEMRSKDPLDVARISRDVTSRSMCTPPVTQKKYRSVGVQTEIYKPPTTLFCCIVPRWHTKKRKSENETFHLNTL